MKVQSAVGEQLAGSETVDDARRFGPSGGLKNDMEGVLSLRLSLRQIFASLAVGQNHGRA